MILYAIADTLYRKIGCNRAASRTKSSPRRWWNQIVQWDWGRPTYVGGRNPETGDAILMNAQEYYKSGAVIIATEAYLNQAAQKKSVQDAVNQGLLAYLLITTGIINIPIRFFAITIDLFICQPIVFLYDMILFPAVYEAIYRGKRGNYDADMWSPANEERRTREWNHLKDKSFSEITKSPSWINW